MLVNPSTELTVADIGLRVGYHGVGTFSARFAQERRPPYRRLGGYTPAVFTSGQLRGDDTITGMVRDIPRGLIFMGVFPHRIPEGPPSGVRRARPAGPGDPNRERRVPLGPAAVSA